MTSRFLLPIRCAPVELATDLLRGLKNVGPRALGRTAEVLGDGLVSEPVHLALDEREPLFHGQVCDDPFDRFAEIAAGAVAVDTGGHARRAEHELVLGPLATLQ